MAQGSKEHRMVFDIRGRRRHVVKVVYAILALLMAGSLFLVTGAININSLFGSSSSGGSAVSNFEKQAENIEVKLAKTPGDEALLAGLTRTRLNVWHSLITEGAGESESGVEEVRQQLALASEDWSEYLKATSEPSAGIAVQVSPALFQLAQLSTGGEEALENLKAASEAEKIVAAARPSLNSWSTLALYSVLAQEYKAGEAAIKKAIGYAGTKFERESIENEFEKYEKSAKEFGKQLKAEKAAKSKSASQESIENPLQGLGGSSLSGG
jgi:hypothetical protein